MAHLGMVLHHGIEDGAQLRGYGQLSERLGYDSLWVTERYFHEETAALLGFLAAGTERIGLGVGVVNPYTRPPALLAMTAATLDRLSGGRLVLGLGRSERDVIEGALGIPYGSPRERLREAVESVRALLAGDAVDGVRLALTPAASACRSTSPRSALGRCGSRGPSPTASCSTPTRPPYVRRAVAELRDAAREAGRDPDAVRIACMLVVRLSDEPDTLRPQLRERLASLLAEPYTGEVLLEWGGFDASLPDRLRETLAASGPPEAARLVGDELIDALVLLGDAERCRERIEEYRAAGVEEVLLLPRLPDFERVARALAPSAG